MRVVKSVKNTSNHCAFFDRYRHEFKEVSEEDIPVHSIPIDELSRENFYNLI